MKKCMLGAALLIAGIESIACPVCERQQPKILQGIAHGGGPQSNWDYLIILVAVIIVMGTLYYSIKWLVRPGEHSATHIKNLIINCESDGR